MEPMNKKIPNVKEAVLLVGILYKNQIMNEICFVKPDLASEDLTYLVD